MKHIITVIKTLATGVALMAVFMIIGTAGHAEEMVFETFVKREIIWVLIGGISFKIAQVAWVFEKD